jgi:hypothetical protein
MTIEARKTASRFEHSGETRMDSKTYVRKKFAECLGVFADEIMDEDEITNVQAHDLIKDAGIYFNFRVFLHSATFSETNPFFTVSQCIKLIRLHLRNYHFRFRSNKV